MHRPASTSTRSVRPARRRLPLRPLLLLALLAVLAGAVLQPASAGAEQAGGSAGFADVLRLTPAQASTLQQSMDSQLRAHPGGRQISQYEIAYAGGSVVVALPAPGRRAAAPATAAAVRDTGAVNVRAGAVPDAASTAGTAAAGTAAALAARASSAAAQPLGDSGSCPYSFTTKWFCWYTDASFDGARFQFSSDYCPGLAQSAINFADWGRDNTATSWVNNRFSAVQVYDGPSGTGALLWTEPRVSSSANVGASVNDRASSARTC